MTSSVNIAELKAKLSQYLRQVRSGGEVVVMDRDRPVARLLPYVEPSRKPKLNIRKAARPVRAIESLQLPPIKRLKRDVVELLLEERAKR